MIKELENAAILASIAPYQTMIEIEAYGFYISVFDGDEKTHGWLIGFDTFEVDQKVIANSMIAIWDQIEEDKLKEVQEQERQEEILERRSKFHLVGGHEES